MLLKKETTIDHDDITVLSSTVEYDSNKNLKYLLYKILAKDANGKKVELYKAIKFIRVIRLPKTAKQEIRFMDIHSEILSGLWERGVNLITVISNMLYPVPIGLLFCYGVQGVAEDLEDAKALADADFAALQAGLQGNYRTMEYRDLNSDEIEWLRDKISSMKNLSMLRGLPQAKEAPGEGGIGFGGMNINPDTMETTEEIVAGLSDREYVIMMISSPVSEGVLSKWLTTCSKANTKWQSQMQGTTGLNFGINIPMMFMGNVGSSQGWNEGSSDSENYGESLSESDSTSFSESFGTSHTVSNGTSEGWSEGSNIGTNEGTSTNIGFGTNEGTSTSASQSHGTSEGTSHTTSSGTSDGNTRSVGSNQSVSNGTSTSESHAQGTSTNHSINEGSSYNKGTSHTTSNGGSTNWSKGGSWNVGGSETGTHTEGSSHADTSGKSFTETRTSTASGNIGFNVKAIKVGGGYSHAWGNSVGTTYGESDTTSQSDSLAKGINYGIGGSSSNGGGTSWSTANGNTQSWGTSKGESWGTGTSETFSRGTGTSHTVSSGTSISDSTSRTVSNSISDGTTRGTSASTSIGTGTSQGSSQSFGSGTSQGSSQGQSFGRSGSVSNSVSDGTSHTISNGTGHSTGSGVTWGNGRGTSQGFTQALSSGTSASMGVGASLGISKAYQFIDVEVRNIVQIYEYQTERLNKALNGQGAFFTDLYIATPDAETRAAATTLAKSAWQNEQAFFCPLQVIDIEGEELQHMLYHFAAFSSCNTKEGIKGSIQGYKYSTILLADELTAYTHPVRLSEGGQFADLENIPVMSVPSMMKGEIYIGKVLSGERWVKNDGYKTKFDYRIDGATNMHHSFFTGESRSGKTVMATRFVVETALKTTRNGKKMRIVVLDPKQDWRVLGKFIDSDRFKFYSLGDPELLPIKLNLLRIPKNVRPQIYADGVIEAYCRSYQLGEKVKPILRDAIYRSYEEAGCFCKEWREVASDLSKNVSFSGIYRRVKKKMEDLKAMRATPSILEAYERLLDRLDMFSKDYTVEYQMFGQGGEDALSIDSILGEDDVTVLESYGLDNTFKSFVFGTIVTAIWFYCYSHEGGFKAEDQFSTLLVIEEANEVLIGQSSADSSSPVQGTSMFEKIVDQAAGLELFICAITQKIADMPQSIVANTGLAFSGKISREEDKNVFMNKIGKDPRIDDKNVLKFLPKMPTGWFMCKSGRSFDYKETEAVLVAVDRLDVDPPTNKELLDIMKLREITLKLKEKE